MKPSLRHVSNARDDDISTGTNQSVTRPDVRTLADRAESSPFIRARFSPRVGGDDDLRSLEARGEKRRSFILISFFIREQVRDEEHYERQLLSISILQPPAGLLFVLLNVGFGDAALLILAADGRLLRALVWSFAACIG